MLLLQKKFIINCALFTVRFFGGIKLGKGGLARAYTESAKLALDNAVIKPYIIYKKGTLTVSYHQFELVEKELVKHDIIILDKIFSDQVTCFIQFQKEQEENMKLFFSEIGLHTYVIID